MWTCVGTYLGMCVFGTAKFRVGTHPSQRILIIAPDRRLVGAGAGSTTIGACKFRQKTLVRKPYDLRVGPVRSYVRRGPV